MHRVVDRFAGGPLTRWSRLAVGSSGLEWNQGVLRFSIRNASDSELSDAEIGDYRTRTRKTLPWRPPLRLAVRARFSHNADQLDGTSGFGFWNSPFDLITGEMLAPPNALWFFSASARSDMDTAPGMPGNGFRAEMIHGGTLPAWVMALGRAILRLPAMGRLLYQASQTRMRAAGVRLRDVEMTAWHEYVLFWDHRRAVYSVDDQEVLAVSNPPRLPLGFVAWMDNQVAVARPDGEFSFGLEAISRPQWLEIDHIVIEPL